MTTDAEDRSTWPRNGQIIRRDELLRLIEENGDSWGLDLRGADFVGYRPGGRGSPNPIDLSPETLVPLAQAYRQANEGSDPPWLAATGGMNLRGAQLQGARLEGAQLQGADLAGAHLQGAWLEGAELQGARLWHAQLQWAWLEGAQLQGADLWYAQLQGARLKGAQLQGARLWHVQLQEARLKGAQLQGANLTQAQLEGADLALCQLEAADLRYSHLEGADMYHVNTLDGAHWYAVNLDHTRINRESLGEAVGDEIEAHQNKTAQAYSQASEAYLALKNNFNQIGRYEDASWAYVKEQRMEKMAHYWGWRSRGWQVWRGRRPFWRWFGNRAFEFLTGHGEEPLKAVRAGVLTILGFAVGFTQAIGNFWDALVYSIATFATFNLARLEPQGRGMEIASSIEAILGISVLALVVFTLGNRMSRG